MEDKKESPIPQEKLDKAVKETVQKMGGLPQNMKDTLTEVTSVAKEEDRTGETIPMPTPEQLVANSSSAIIANRKHLANVLPKLGKKAMQRIILASLDLPKEGEVVRLQKDEEKLAFRLMQSTIRAMYTVLFYHTSEEIIKKHKEEQANKEAK